MSKDNNEKVNNEMKTSKGNGVRYNTGKLRYDLVNPLAHKDMVEVLTKGAEKYAERNWENGLSWTSVLASLKRHIAAFENGEDYDKDDGLLHIAHAACNVHFLNSFYYMFPQGDDRPRKFRTKIKIGLDIDGVLADFTKAWKALYDDVVDSPNSWFMDYKMLERFEDMKYKKTLNDFYANIPVLTKPEDIPFDPCCYITSRPVPTSVTEKWIKDNGFPQVPIYTVELRKSKVEAAKEAGVDIFVDDSYGNFTELNEAGIFTYLFDASYNQKFDVGHMRVKDLNNLPILK